MQYIKNLEIISLDFGRNPNKKISLKKKRNQIKNIQGFEEEI